MVEIKILLFALTTFYGIEYGRIFSEKTTVTIYTKEKIIEILEEDLFTIPESTQDSTLTVEQWKQILANKEQDSTWTEELDHFPEKEISIQEVNNKIQARITLHYRDESDLKSMGIWYDPDKNQFALNYEPQIDIKSSDGKKEGNYWVFNPEDTIRFSIDVFQVIPMDYRSKAIPLEDLLPRDLWE